LSWADPVDNHGTRNYAEPMFSLLAYLDQGSATVGPVELVLAAVVAIFVLLAVVYALTRFVAWAAKR
jgi:hypothetical protein